MLNSHVNPNPWRPLLQQSGRIQIPEFLTSENANALLECLQQQVPWTLAYRNGDQAQTVEHLSYQAMTESQRTQLVQACYARNPQCRVQPDFRFAYESYMMVRAYLEKRDPGLLLHQVLEIFNSTAYLDFARALTGDRRIQRINAQATRYRAGHFLRWHTDEDHSEGRLYAYVLNLTPHWHADWGGILEFINSDGRMETSLHPAWNSLSVFKVPTGHAVSLVAPWAEASRLAITGWFLL